MSRDLAGRVAIITGGSDGIGLATASLLAQRGAHVVICGRRQEMLDKARARIEGEGGSIAAAQLDVTDFEGFAALVASTAEKHGRLDMLVNNAMSNHFAPIARMTMDHWRKDFAVNADAVFIGTKAAMKVMAAQGHGSIVNISSTTAIRAMENYAAYSASKAALIQFTACAAMEGARQGIRVNAVVPGQVNTAASLDFAAESTRDGRKGCRRHPDGARRQARGARRSHRFPAIRRSEFHHRGCAAGRWRQGGAALYAWLSDGRTLSPC